MIRKHIPNCVTLCNLLFGCLSVTFSFEGNLYLAGIFILIAAVCDLMDGMLARLLRAWSRIGKDLDSLADMVSFGLAPAAIAYTLLQPQLDFDSWNFIRFFPFLMTLASAYRLAKFNNDEEQKHFFKGMPTPANAMLWAFLAIYCSKQEVTMDSIYIILLTPLLSYLLISNLRMFSFKISDWSWKEQKIIYIYLLICLGLALLFKMLGLACAILLYPLFSRIYFVYRKTNSKNS